VSNVFILFIDEYRKSENKRRELFYNWIMYLLYFYVVCLGVVNNHTHSKKDGRTKPHAFIP